MRNQTNFWYFSQQLWSAWGIPPQFSHLQAYPRTRAQVDKISHLKDNQYTEHSYSANEVQNEDGIKSDQIVQW